MALGATRLSLSKLWMLTVADGALRNVAFEIPVERSSWLCLLGSAHTNPIFVIVGDRPMRGSRQSAEWCLKAVDQCWS